MVEEVVVVVEDTGTTAEVMEVKAGGLTWAGVEATVEAISRATARTRITMAGWEEDTAGRALDTAQALLVEAAEGLVEVQ